MFKPVRAGATIIFLCALGLTLYCAIAIQQALPVILCMLVQLCAMIWYCASYVPYGQSCIRNVVGGLCDVE